MEGFHTKITIVWHSMPHVQWLNVEPTQAAAAILACWQHAALGGHGPVFLALGT
jgi:hypothetical protein